MRAQIHSPAVLCAALALSLTACKKEQGSGMVGADAKGPVIVGHVASMTGPDATFGVSSDRGFRLLFDDVNGKGGVKGRQIKLVTLDDQGKPEEAATALVIRSRRIDEAAVHHVRKVAVARKC